MTDKVWKQVERAVAKFFSTVRRAGSGAYGDIELWSVQDILDTEVVVQVKRSKDPRKWTNIPRLYRATLDTMREESRKLKIPRAPVVLALKDNSIPKGFLLVLHSDDLLTVADIVRRRQNGEVTMTANLKWVPGDPVNHQEVTRVTDDKETERERGVSGTREWSNYSENIHRPPGCPHGCRYCYAAHREVKRFKRVKTWSCPQVNEGKVYEARPYPQREGTIMFPTSHDITPENVVPSIHFLRRMLSAGNRVLIVSKPHLSVIRDLTNELEEFKELILFRFTIGSMNDDVLAWWEPGAPGFQERVQSLTLAYERGFQTSVSIEPYLDASVFVLPRFLGDKVVTDSIWIGTMNKVKERVDLEDVTPEEMERFVKPVLLVSQDDVVLDLVRVYEDNPLVRWKDSVKVIAGMVRPTEEGLDI